MVKNQFTIITLFPNAFSDFMQTSIIKRAISKKQISIDIVNIRNFADNKQQQVDDAPYGGGNGMVLQAMPVINAISNVKLKHPNAKTILLSPQGQQWNQQLAYQYSQKDINYILVCGHYEGIDERIMPYIDEELSIGDYVLTGGELPAMVIIDCVTRLIPNVIQHQSHLNDSFNNWLLDYPTYTRPEEVLGMKVPAVLIGGHHEKIAQYRHQQALINTYKKRIDLFKKYQLSAKDKIIIEEYKDSLKKSKRKEK